MSKRWMVAGLVVMALVGMIYASTVMAQAGRAGRGGRPGFAGRGGPGGQRQGMDREERRERFREMIMDRLREHLDSTEEEWKVLGPRVEKVSELSRQLQGRAGRGMMRLMFQRRGPGGRGGGPGGPGGRDRGPGVQQEAELQPIERATEDLQEIVDSEGASPQDIQEKLTALRKAEDKMEQELDKARAKLREVVTLRQEAKLVLLGMLD